MTYYIEQILQLFFSIDSAEFSESKFCYFGIIPGSRDSNSNDMKYPVLLMESVQKITEGFESLLTDRNKKKLAGYMQKLGFEDISAMFYKLNPETGREVVNQLSTALLPPTPP